MEKFSLVHVTLISLEIIKDSHLRSIHLNLLVIVGRVVTAGGARIAAGAGA